jgi:hypothetical protein
LNCGTKSFFQARPPNLFLLACSINDLFISCSKASLVVYLTQGLYLISNALASHNSHHLDNLSFNSLSLALTRISLTFVYGVTSALALTKEFFVIFVISSHSACVLVHIAVFASHLGHHKALPTHFIIPHNNVFHPAVVAYFHKLETSALYASSNDCSLTHSNHNFQAHFSALAVFINALVHFVASGAYFIYLILVSGRANRSIISHINLPSQAHFHSGS